MNASLVRLPDVARTLLKSMIVTLATTGLITSADAEMLVTILGLSDA